jgi:hypothetical protein
MNKIFKWILWILGGLLILLAVIVLVVGLIPVPKDEPLTPPIMAQAPAPSSPRTPACNANSPR